jgi:hypothetical protein
MMPRFKKYRQAKRVALADPTFVYDASRSGASRSFHLKI